MWFKSSTFLPGKSLTLTLWPPPHNPSSKTLMMESPTINVVFFGHCSFSVVLSAILLWKWFLNQWYSSLFYFYIVQLFFYWINFPCLNYTFLAESLSDCYLYSWFLVLWSLLSQIRLYHLSHLQSEVVGLAVG